MSTTRALAVLVLLGLAIRLALAASLGGGLHAVPSPGSDQAEYDQYAWNLAEGRGYRGVSPDVEGEHPTAYRPPAPSVLWAGLYVLFEHRLAAIRIAHCVLGALTVLLVYDLGRRCFDHRVGLLAAAAYTVWPSALLYSTELLSETLGALTLLAYVLASLAFAARPSLGRASLAGLLLGAAMLTRAGVALMVPLAGVWALWQFRHEPRVLVRGLAIPAVAALTLVPWTVRNYLVFDEVIPLSTMGGSVLLQANNRIVVTDPVYFGYGIWDTAIQEYRDALRAPGNEVERDRVARRLAVEWLSQNRDKWLFLAQAKLRRGFTPFLTERSPRLYRLGMLLSWGPVLVLFGLAFFPLGARYLRSGHPGWLLHLVVLHFVALTVIFYGFARYRFPIEGIALVFATAAGHYAWAKAPGRAQSESPTDESKSRVISR